MGFSIIFGTNEIGTGAIRKSENKGAFGASVGGNDYGKAFSFDAKLGEQKSDGTYQNDVYGKQDHLTPMNITKVIWKRIL